MATIVLFAVLITPVPFVAQTTGTGESDTRRTGKHNTHPSAGATITKFYIAKAAPDSAMKPVLFTSSTVTELMSSESCPRCRRARQK